MDVRGSFDVAKVFPNELGATVRYFWRSSVSVWFFGEGDALSLRWTTREWLVPIDKTHERSTSTKRELVFS